MAMFSALGSQLAEAFNKDCYCIAVDKDKLHTSLEANLKESGLPDKLLNTHSNMFADSPVFLWQGHIQKMQQLVQAVEQVTRNESYRQTVLARLPEYVNQDFGPRGVFFGYDFHLGEDGPQLIEINTNAGGALLNLYLAAAQQACCSAVSNFFGNNKNFTEAEDELVAMFQNEWRLQRPDIALHTIAIVDNEPEKQFLYPEFLLFQSLFKRHGIEAIITDPGDFSIRNNGLYVGERKIDLVYNRLTDFYLEAPESACLLEAYKQDLAVVTPSPHAYALFADKRNLPLLSDADKLRKFGVEENTIGVLAECLPKTVAVTAANAGELWRRRKQFFFKPATGYGSRGAYRGAKLTKRVWENIINDDYIAQAIIPPSERQLQLDGEKQAMKLDIRCVTYNGEIQHISARLYQGQTTNLRTTGGGLATVFSTPEVSCC